MNFTWRDVLASALAVLGAVVVFAKLQSYTWWLIGSWKGALAVLGAIGLAILLTNVVELIRMEDIAVFAEATLWLIAAAVAIAGMLVTTTKTTFISAAIAIGVSWLAQLVHHAWISTHTHRPHLVHAS